MNRVDRLMGYLLLFQSRGLMRAQDFAAYFEVSERTVYRDIQALSEIGVPVMAMPGEGYRLMEGYYLPPITFSHDEARALFLAVSMLRGTTREGRTRAAASTALEKMRAVLPKATRAQVEALEAVLGFYTMGRERLDLDDGLFLRLQQAIHERRVVHLRYHAQTSNEVSERDVEPLHLAFVDKVWILTGYCRLRQDQRNFRLDRIDRLGMREETFAPREMVPLSPEPGEVEVVVRFDEDVVRWVRERQHFSFVRERDDGPRGTVMVYRPPAFEQFAGWLLSWHGQCEVLAPPALRRLLRETAERVRRRHED